MIEKVKNSEVLYSTEGNNDDRMRTEKAEMNESSQNILVRIEPVLVGLEDLAAMLGLSVSTVKQMDRTGRLGPMSLQVQTIKRRLWRVDEVRAWAQAGFPIREKWDRMKG